MRSILNTIVVAFLFAISISSHSFAQSETINQKHKLASDIDFTFIETDYSSSEVMWRLKFKGFRWAATNFVANWFAPDGSLFLSNTFKTKWANNNEAETKLKLTDEIINTKLGIWKLQVYSGGVLLDEKEFDIKSPADTQVRNKQQEESVDTTETKKATEMQKAEVEKLFNPSNRFKIGLYFSGRLFGGEKIEVGETTKGETITLRTAGGFGPQLLLGYNFYSKVDIDLTAGFQSNTLSHNVVNMKGSFHRSPLLVTLKYWIPIKKNVFLKLGGGPGFYRGVEYDVEIGEFPGVQLEERHEVIKYDNAAGFHITAECEMFGAGKPLRWMGFSFPFLTKHPNLTLIIGVKYYNVTYNASSATLNGISVPVSYVRKKLRELDGSGFDFKLGLGWYF